MYRKIFSASVHGVQSRLGEKRKKLGLAPGSVVYTGEHAQAQSTVFVTDYGPKEVLHRKLQSGEALPPLQAKRRWIQVSGLSDTAYIERLGEQYNIPPLVLEDIVNPQHGAKVEDCDTFLFIIVKIPVIHEKTREIRFEQVSILLFENEVISFQETEVFHFEPLKLRLDNSTARMRQNGSDYFVYAMMDLVVDTYMFLGEVFREKMDQLEDAVVDTVKKTHVEDIHRIKQMISKTRKVARPIRAITELLASGDTPHIRSEIEPYLRDLRDHVNQLSDALENQREEAMALMDSYLSLMSHRMNEVMKMLTIVSTIFIPLGFLAGVYGMNFDYMPELRVKYAYFFVLGGMVTAAVSMVMYFRWKKWL